jgi:tetratricopeptide (TPR) repeat protein
MAFKAAVCPSCGGQLQVPDDRDSVKCMYCGTEIVVREAIRAGSGVNIHNYLDLAMTAANAGNFKEAYDYYSKVLEIDIKNTEAWFGKAKAAGWLSTVGEARFPEVKSGFQNAIKYASEEDKKALNIQCAVAIHQLSLSYFELIYGYVVNNSSVENVWENFLSQAGNLIDLLEFGLQLDPNNQQIMKDIISICNADLEGVKYTFYTSNGPTDSVRRVSESYKVFLTNKINEYSTKLQKFDPNYKPPSVKRKYSTNEMICICCIAAIVIIFLIYIVTKGS